MTITIAHSEPDLHQEIVVTKEDGSEQRIAFRCRTNGEPDQCRLDGQEVRGSAHWQGDELVIELWMQQWHAGALPVRLLVALSRRTDADDGTSK